MKLRKIWKRITRQSRFNRVERSVDVLFDSLIQRDLFNMSKEEHDIWMAEAEKVKRNYRRLIKLCKNWM